jgi:Putative MetA-pathway of phenol degradation
MRRFKCCSTLCVMAWNAAHAQMPFYTDDTEVTDLGVLHSEVYDELDSLQSAQYPDLRQNTINLKVNLGLPHRLEFDIDAPYLSIHRAPGSPASNGIGDTDFGLKWKMRDTSPGSGKPALAASFYVEVPTGNVREELGSGLTDYWLNLIAQEQLSERTRLNANAGILFAGNSSTGVVGIETRRGQVFTAGISILHDMNDRLTLGSEIYGGIADRVGLDRTQLQFLLGGEYSISHSVAFCFGVVAGKFTASPQLGAQVGFAVDFPSLFGAGNNDTPGADRLPNPVGVLHGL